MTVLGGFVYFVFLTITSSIFNGYALSVLWGWFVVPTFHAPQLSVAAAIGIAMVVRYLTHQMPDDGEKKKKRSFNKSMVRMTIITIMKPSIVLLFGYVIHLFM